MTDRVVAVLDKCRISYRDCVHLIFAVAEALGYNTEELIINKTSFYKRITQIRKQKSENIKKYLAINK